MVIVKDWTAWGRGSLVVALTLTGASTLAGCPTRGPAMVYVDDDSGDNTVTDLGAPAPDRASPIDRPVIRDEQGHPADLGIPPVDDMAVPPTDGGMPPTDAVTPPDDTGTPDDTGPARPGCPTPTPPTHAEPCPGHMDCGLPSHGTVTITGVRTALLDFQVHVTLPAAVLGAIGPACDRLAFRSGAAGTPWAPHFVTNCATGDVWVRVPGTLPAAPTTLTMYYGGTTAVPAANSYDDTFDRVPMHAANTLGAYAFDEGTGSITCPTVGAEPLDAHVHYNLYDDPAVLTEVATRPPLWSSNAAPSLLSPTAHFTRNQHSLNFPEVPVLPAAGLASPNRIVNWQSRRSTPWNTATTNLSVGVWTSPDSPSNHFNDNFQTVVCYGMPNQSARAAFWHLPETDPGIINNAIFNPWAVFFRGDGEDDTLFQGNSCVEPCTDVMQYAHITTREPLSGAAFVHHWHFLGLTIDTTTRPHTQRRSFYDSHTYQFPQDLDLFPPGGRYCPADPNPAHHQPEPLIAPCYPADISLPDGGTGPGTPTCWEACPYLCPGTVAAPAEANTCVYPPEHPLKYAPAPLMVASDLNDGEPQLMFNGQIDDLFIIARTISPEEMQAYRERRAYSPDPIVTAVAP